jgi:hypothetical protein
MQGTGILATNTAGKETARFSNIPLRRLAGCRELREVDLQGVGVEVDTMFYFHRAWMRSAVREGTNNAMVHLA